MIAPVPGTLNASAGRSGNPGFRQDLVQRQPLLEPDRHGKTAFAHCPWAKGALCYGELVMEILDG